MDYGIGRVIKSLKETNQFENTLIIFTSDNGGHNPSKANNGPLRDGKQSVYEGGLKVPTVLSWEKNIKKNISSNKTILTMDLYPTILEIAGDNNKLNIDGTSFADELYNPKKNHKNDRNIYFVRREGGMKYSGKTISAIRKGSWKLLQNSPFDSLELYNLDLDPQEKNNLINSEREVYNELNKLLMNQIQQGGSLSLIHI